MGGGDEEPRMWIARGVNPFWDNNELFEVEGVTVDDALDAAMDIGDINGWQILEVITQGRNPESVELGPVEREIIWTDILLEVNGHLIEESLPGLTATMVLDLAEILWGVTHVLALRAAGDIALLREERCRRADVPASWRIDAATDH